MPGKAAWKSILGSLPANWRVGPPTREPGDGWSVTAHGDPPLTVVGSGEDEVAALRDLDGRLRDLEHPEGSTEDEPSGAPAWPSPRSTRRHATWPVPANLRWTAANRSSSPGTGTSPPTCLRGDVGALTTGR